MGWRLLDVVVTNGNLVEIARGKSVVEHAAVTAVMDPFYLEIAGRWCACPQVGGSGSSWDGAALGWSASRVWQFAMRVQAEVF